MIVGTNGTYKAIARQTIGDVEYLFIETAPLTVDTFVDPNAEGEPEPTGPVPVNTLVFHHGNFDDAHGDGDAATALANGNVYADSPFSNFTQGTLSAVTTSDETTYTWTPDQEYLADALVVAGGGGGGGDIGGGGGAGGYLESPGLLLSGSQTIVVGRGGYGRRYDGHENGGSKGKNSSFRTMDAEGGGMAGAGHSTSYNAGSGGSGGGSNSASGNTGPGSGISGQGNSGGNSGGHWWQGGGGGAGDAGKGGNGIRGNGGDGKAFKIRGTEYWFAGGGGASGHSSEPGGHGGKGGGGGGSSISTLGNGDTNGITNGTNGVSSDGDSNGGNGGAHTGGGGGGGTHYSSVGGSGGSGIVVIRTPGGGSSGTGGGSSGTGGGTAEEFTMRFDDTATAIVFENIPDSVDGPDTYQLFRDDALLGSLSMDTDPTSVPIGKTGAYRLIGEKTLGNVDYLLIESPYLIVDSLEKPPVEDSTTTPPDPISITLGNTNVVSVTNFPTTTTDISLVRDGVLWESKTVDPTITSVPFTIVAGGAYNVVMKEGEFLAGESLVTNIPGILYPQTVTKTVDGTYDTTITVPAMSVYDSVAFLAADGTVDTAVTNSDTTVSVTVTKTGITQVPYFLRFVRDGNEFDVMMFTTPLIRGEDNAISVSVTDVTQATLFFTPTGETAEQSFDIGTATTVIVNKTGTYRMEVVKNSGLEITNSLLVDTIVATDLQTIYASKTPTKHPSQPLTSSTTPVGFKSTASTYFNNEDYSHWKAFDGENPENNAEGSVTGWVVLYNTAYDTNGNQAANVSHHSDSAKGDWIQIQLPDTIILTSVSLASRYETTYTNNDTGFPKDVYIYGSNDNTSWTLIKNFTTIAKYLADAHIEETPATEAFNTFAFVVNKSYRGGFQPGTSVGEIELFGHVHNNNQNTTSLKFDGTQTLTLKNVPSDATSVVFTNETTGETADIGSATEIIINESGEYSVTIVTPSVYIMTNTVEVPEITSEQRVMNSIVEPSGEKISPSRAHYRRCMSGDGNVIAIANPESGYQEVKVYVHNSGSWEQLGQTIKDPNMSNEYFGNTLALNYDGTYIVIAEPYVDAGGTDNGSFHVFQLENNTWVSKLYITGSSTHQYVGVGVTISDDGKTVAGLGGGHSAVNDYNGWMYIYRQNDTGSYSHIGTLNGNYRSQPYRCKFAKDGNMVIMYSGNVLGTPCTKVWTYDGSSWTRKGSDINYESHSLSLADDGDFMAISDYSTDGNKGSVRFIKWDGSEWVQDERPNITGDTASVGFGSRDNMVMSPYKNIVYVSSPNYNNNKGRMQVFSYDGSKWNLVKTYDGEVTGNYFGSQMYLSKNGTVLSHYSLIADATEHIVYRIPDYRQLTFDGFNKLEVNVPTDTTDVKLLHTKDGTTTSTDIDTTTVDLSSYEITETGDYQVHIATTAATPVLKNVTVNNGGWNGHTFTPDDVAATGKYAWDLRSGSATSTTVYRTGALHSLEYIPGHGWFVLNIDSTGFGDVTPTSATTGTYLDVNGTSQSFTSNHASSANGVLTIEHVGGTVTLNEADFFEGGVLPTAVPKRTFIITNEVTVDAISVFEGYRYLGIYVKPSSGHVLFTELEFELSEELNGSTFIKNGNNEPESITKTKNWTYSDPSLNNYTSLFNGVKSYVSGSELEYNYTNDFTNVLFTMDLGASNKAKVQSGCMWTYDSTYVNRVQECKLFGTNTDPATMTESQRMDPNSYDFICDLNVSAV